MTAGRVSLSVPDILAVREDHTEHKKREYGRPCSSDVLSVYLDGGPRYRLDDHTYTFTPPIAILIPEGTLDKDLQEGKVDGIFALFRGRGLLKKAKARKGEVLVSLGKTRTLVPHLKQVSTTDAQQIARTLREIAAIRDADVTGQMRRVSLLFQAIARYCELGSRAGRDGTHREAVRLRQLIEEWAFENVSMARIYREMDLSSAHVGALFRGAFGLSPVAYRTQLRLRRARELLVSSQLNVGQVAFTVGFTDPLYFSRVFRKAFGVPPSSLVYDFDNRRK